MLVITPKLSSEELNRLREYIDQRDGMKLAEKNIGVKRATLRTTILAGTCSEKTAEKIRVFLSSIKKKHK